MPKIAIAWGSTTGRTEEAAEQLAELISDLAPTMLDVETATVEDMAPYDVLLIGVPTWDIGELQYDWSVRYPDLDGHDFSGVKVAFFGAGDSYGYPDNFLDAFGIMWEKYGELGAELIGTWPTDDYEFDASKALIDGGSKFVGLGLDESDDDETVAARLSAWAEQLRREIDA